MRRWRGACAIAVSSTLFAPCALDAPAMPSDADITKSFESHIAQLDTRDPKSPQALETHLRYADYLAKEPREDCGARLNAAQSQLQAAQRNVALSVVLPQGLARAADIEYQIHTALASCGDSNDASHRDAELRAALESAQRAAALYQDTFDYPAMVTMQFNAAVTYQSLGDTTAAQTALNAVIDADREFGFRDDAEENYRLLLSWSRAGATPAQIAASDQVSTLMQDFPQRSTTLKFAWTPGDDVITLNIRSARVIGNGVVHASGDRTLTRRVRRRPFGWMVTYQSLGTHYSLDPLAPRTGMERSFMTSLAGMLVKFHDFTLNDSRSPIGTGADFNETFNRDTFKARARQEANAQQAAGSLLGGLATQDSRTAPLAPVLNTALNDLLLPDAVDAYTALDYNLETGTWPDAILEQGRWYGMKMLLPLPFSPLNFVLHEIQFAFTRELRCAHASNRTCVELVLRAAPNEAALNSTLRRLQHPLHLRHGEALDAASAMYMRIITDPATLHTYQSDMRQQFYASLDVLSDALVGADQSVIEAEPVTPAVD